MQDKIYYSGSRFCYKVPDAFNHEFEERNFMLISNFGNTELSIIYAMNECVCKDGWVKFEKIPTLSGHLGITKDILVEYLKKFYTNKDGECSFDENSLRFL